MNQGQSKEELFHVAGDMPDPSGTGMRGTAPGYNLTKSAIGHPMLFYKLPNGKELVLEADVYALPGEPVKVHIICPICALSGHKGNSLQISQEQKQLSYEPNERVPPPPGWSARRMREVLPDGAGGLLSIEEFGCSWEVQPELQRQFGFAVCPWRVVIDKNVVRDV